VQKLKSEKRQKDQLRKQKVTESRQHLATVRVVQHNLVFVVGLPPRLADGEILKRHEYFGKFGKILKVVINPSNSYAGVQVNYFDLSQGDKFKWVCLF
jgi:CCR4-NOT transcription complex subunit 4